MWPDKLKSFLLELYPELGRLEVFAQLKESLIPKLHPYVQKFLRFGLPIFTIVFVLLSGLIIGQRIYKLRQPQDFTPPPLGLITPTQSVVFSSEFTAIRDGIKITNYQLPDPIPPVVDYKITLEDFDDDLRL